MRDAVGLIAGSAAIGFVMGWATAWPFFRRRALASERTLAERYDSLLQDVQGLTLSLQAVADQLPPGESVRRRLEAILDRTEDLLVEGRTSARMGGE